MFTAVVKRFVVAFTFVIICYTNVHSLFNGVHTMRMVFDNLLDFLFVSIWRRKVETF